MKEMTTMTLIVENGSKVTGANTYISLADARTRATALGVTISSTDADAESQLIRATLYVDRKYRARYQGYKVDETQALQFPRVYVVVDDYMIDSDEIPQELIDAQVYAAAELEAGNSFYTNNDGRSVASEQVTGAVSVSYFNTGKRGSQIAFTAVEDTIRPLLASGTGKTSYLVRS